MPVSTRTTLCSPRHRSHAAVDRAAHPLAAGRRPAAGSVRTCAVRLGVSVDAAAPAPLATAAGGSVAQPPRPGGAGTSLMPSRRPAGDAGMATAEYAVATLAACGFAGLLVALLASGEVRGLLLGIIQRALTIG